MYKALIIGCGNIGALYDIDSDSIATYARAFHLDPEIEFEVYDTDAEACNQIARRYEVAALHELPVSRYPDYDIVAICSPTPTHYAYLEPMLAHGPALIMCEKPVDINPGRLDRLERLYRASESSVLVNLFRRFQPGYIELKREIEVLLAQDYCTNVVVSYQRGFHNNAIHAIDLLEYLFDACIDFAAAEITHSVSDEFDNDPTVSLACRWRQANLQIVGLAKVEFSHFEIAVYFQRHAILIRNAGNDIEFWRRPEAAAGYYPRLELSEHREGVLENYMQNVVIQGKKMLKRPARDYDNFLQSVAISQRILKLQGH